MTKIKPKIAVFIKLGGSLITDKTKPLHAKPQAIQQIAEELADCYRSFPDLCWFIGNGAGSYGHYTVQQTGWQKHTDNPYKTALVRQSTAHLNVLLLDALIAAGLPVIALPPAAMMVDSPNGSVLSKDSIFAWVAMGAIPLVYGDLVPDLATGSSLIPTESSLFEIATAWQAAGNSVQSIIYCTSVDGVLDKNGQTIDLLTNELFDEHIGDAEGFDVSGGMRQKVLAGMQALSLTKNVHIINGSKQGSLRALLAGHPSGTLLARPTNL
jgi:isopentenyl phosphate kinase